MQTCGSTHLWLIKVTEGNTSKESKNTLVVKALAVKSVASIKQAYVKRFFEIETLHCHRGSDIFKDALPFVYLRTSLSAYSC